MRVLPMACSWPGCGCARRPVLLRRDRTALDHNLRGEAFSEKRSAIPDRHSCAFCQFGGGDKAGAFDEAGAAIPNQRQRNCLTVAFDPEDAGIPVNRLDGSNAALDPKGAAIVLNRLDCSALDLGSRRPCGCLGASCDESSTQCCTESVRWYFGFGIHGVGGITGESLGAAKARRCARFHFHSSTAQKRQGAM